MSGVHEIIAIMERNPKGVRFSDLCKVREAYFGEARIKATSHRIYKTPWVGDPRVNIQNDKGYAKAYQVRQVLKALEKMEEENAKSQR